MFDDPFDQLTSNRRHARVALGALGRLSNDCRVMTCVVEDLSSAGARLRLDPEAAALLSGEGWVLSAALLGAMPVRIRWRDLDHIGASFEVDPEVRARLDRFVKAVIHYAPASCDDGDEAEEGATPRDQSR